MAHTFVNKSQDVDQTGNPIVITHTPGAVATVAILSIVTTAAVERTGGAPTIDGTTATQADQFRTGAENGVEVWYVCKAFDSGEFTVSIPNSGSLTCNCEIVTADAGTGFDSVFQDAAGTSVPGPQDDGLQVDLTSSATGDFLYCRLGCGENDPADVTETSTNPTKTLTYSNDHGAESSRGDYGISDGAGTESFIYVWVNEDGCAVGVAFKSVVAAASPLSVSGLSDESKITDSTTVQFNELVASASDQAAVQDSTAVQLNELVASVSDSIEAQDGATVLPELILSASDSVGVDESTSSEVGGIPALTLSATDTVGIDESVSQDVVEVTDRSLSVQDKVAVEDGTSVALDLLLLSGTDSASATDSISASLNELVLSLSDAVDVAEAAANKLEPLLASVGDSVDVDEGIASQLNELYVSLADSVDTLETIQGARSSPGEYSVSDSVGVSDSASASLDFLRASALDTAGVSEEISSALDVLQVSVSDVVASTEQVSAALLIFREAATSDGASLDDSVEIQLDSLNVSAGDQVGVNETLAALRDTVDAALEDAATVSDAAYALLDVVPLQISDAVIIADSTNVVVYDQEVTLSVSDSIGVSEGYPVRTIPDPTKALGHKSYGSDAGHKSKGLKSE